MNKYLKYIPNVLLAATSMLFLYQGSQMYASAGKNNVEVKRLEQKEDSHLEYLIHSIRQDAKQDNLGGSVSVMLGGAMLLVSMADARKRRKEEID